MAACFARPVSVEFVTSASLVDKTSVTSPSKVEFAARKNLSKKLSSRSVPLVRAEGAPTTNSTLTGVVFEPFAEVQSQLTAVPSTSNQSYARQRFSPACEAAINEQINVEYNMSYLYHSLFAYFDRDYVGLKGFAQYFKHASLEEREHAEKFMEYQNTRGGKVKFQSIMMPDMTEFDHPEKGDALFAMELVLALEKLTNEKLLQLHSVAEQNNDPQLLDFIEGNFLAEQVEDIKKVSEYVSQLRRVGKGLGVYQFDQQLQEENA